MRVTSSSCPLHCGEKRERQHGESWQLVKVEHRQVRRPGDAGPWLRLGEVGPLISGDAHPQHHRRGSPCYRKCRLMLSYSNADSRILSVSQEHVQVADPLARQRRLTPLLSLSLWTAPPSINRPQFLPTPAIHHHVRRLAL
jgi:hypothetical protein